VGFMIKLRQWVRECQDQVSILKCNG